MQSYDFFSRTARISDEKFRKKLSSCEKTGGLHQPYRSPKKGLSDNNNSNNSFS